FPDDPLIITLAQVVLTKDLDRAGQKKESHMRLRLKSKPIITGLALVLLFSSLSFKCGGGPANDPNGQFRTAAKASDDVAQGISQMIDLKRKLAQQGKM